MLLIQRTRKVSFLLGGGLVLFMDLDKYTLPYAVPAQACKEKQGERARSSARLLWMTEISLSTG